MIALFAICCFSKVIEDIDDCFSAEGIPSSFVLSPSTKNCYILSNTFPLIFFKSTKEFSCTTHIFDPETHEITSSSSPQTPFGYRITQDFNVFLEFVSTESTTISVFSISKDELEGSNDIILITNTESRFVTIPANGISVLLSLSGEFNVNPFIDPDSQFYEHTYLENKQIDFIPSGTGNFKSILRSTKEMYISFSTNDPCFDDNYVISQDISGFFSISDLSTATTSIKTLPIGCDDPKDPSHSNDGGYCYKIKGDYYTPTQSISFFLYTSDGTSYKLNYINTQTTFIRAQETSYLITLQDSDVSLVPFLNSKKQCR